MKTLVNITVPAIDKSYDMFIPNFLTIKELTVLIARAVEDLTNKKYIYSGSEFLCLKDKDLLLKQDATPAMYGIRNGDKLFLI